MIASISEKPWRAARMTDSGMPPTPIQVGQRPVSRCGTTSCSRSAARVLPSQVTGAALEQLGEERGLLLEELLVVGQVVAEQRERVDAGAASEDDLGPATGDRVERRVALEHPDGVIGAEHGDRGAKVDALVRAAIAASATSAADSGKSSV